MWQVRPASVPLLPRLRPRTGELRLVAQIRLVGHPEGQARNADRNSREVSLYSPRPNLPATPKIEI